MLMTEGDDTVFVLPLLLDRMTSSAAVLVAQSNEGLVEEYTVGAFSVTL